MNPATGNINADGTEFADGGGTLGVIYFITNPSHTSGALSLSIYFNNEPSPLTIVGASYIFNLNHDQAIAQGLSITSGSMTWVFPMVLTPVPSKTSGAFTLYEPLVFEYVNPSGKDNSSITSGRLYLFAAPETVNRFWTSDVGGEISFDFSDESSTAFASDNPLPFAGWTYKGMKLGSAMIIYAQNGVIRATPGEIFNHSPWGQKKLHSIGLKGKMAACGDEDVHYFVDAEGWLGIITEQGVQMVDYSEFLAPLNNSVVMNLDPRNRLVKISDGNLGFTYSPSGLGGGLKNITGMALQSGCFYLTTDLNGVKNTPLHIMTDILDFGSRGNKTVNLIRVATDVISNMQVCLNFRKKSDANFRASKWYPVRSGGLAYTDVTAVEFQIEIKQLAFAQTTIDQVQARGKYWQ